MKAVGKLLFVFAFIFLSPLFLLLVSIRWSGYSASSIKTQLVGANVYEQLIHALNTTIDEAVEKGEADDPLRILGPILKRELTPLYLQQKIEPAIDSTASWMTGKTDREPVLSFTDLKERLTKQHPQLFRAFEVARELKKSGEETETSVAIEKLLKSDFTVPLGAPLRWLKTLYFFATTGLVLGVVTLTFLIVGIIFLSDTPASKLHWLGATFLISAVWNVTPWLFGFGAQKMLVIFAQKTVDVPAFVVPLVNIFLQPFFTSYVRVGGIAIAIFFFIAIACFFAHRKRS